VRGKRKPDHVLFITLRVWGGGITLSAVIVESTANFEQFYLLVLLDEILAEDTAIGEVASD
jgi:hypothetical protein